MLKVVKDGQATVVANRINDAANTSTTFTWSVNKIKSYVSTALEGYTPGSGGSGISQTEVEGIVDTALAAYETAVVAEGKYVAKATLNTLKTFLLSEIGVDTDGNIIGTASEFATTNKDVSIWKSIEDLQSAIASAASGIDTGEIVDIPGAGDLPGSVTPPSGASVGELFYVTSHTGGVDSLSIFKKLSASTSVLVLTFSVSLNGYATIDYVNEKTKVDGNTIKGTGTTASPFYVANPVWIGNNDDFEAIVSKKDGLYALTDV
jgi:hypothetical protein